MLCTKVGRKLDGARNGYLNKVPVDRAMISLQFNVRCEHGSSLT